MNIKKIFFLGLVILLGRLGYSQIVDDSTRLVYGTHSTKYVLENDVLNNYIKLNDIDTSINDFHNYDFMFRGTYVYQNLGNLGTPLNNIYYQAPTTIGRGFGFNSYTPYAFDPNKVRYYETKSPYSNLYYVQGANGQQILDGAFSRNIKPNWNAGFEINKIHSKKLIGEINTKDPQADHTSFLFYSRYFAKDSSYQIMGNFSIMDHKNYESGGVFLPAGKTIDDLFQFRNDTTFLQGNTSGGARSYERRLNFHVFQQYNPFKSQLIQLYEIFDYSFQRNRFRSYFPSGGFYPNLNIPINIFEDSVGTNDMAQFDLIENKVGLKGNLSKLYYRFFYHRKDLNYSYFTYNSSIPDHRKSGENFFGTALSYNLPFNATLNFSGEYLFKRDLNLVGGSSTIGNDYYLRGEFDSKYLKAGYYNIYYSPSLLQGFYFGNNLQWNNENLFKNTQLNEFYASGLIKWKKLLISPGFKYDLISDFVYYDSLAKPAQFSPTISYFSADLGLNFTFKNFHLENLIRYTSASGLLKEQVPQIFEHGRFYYQNRLFKGKPLLMQVGLDLFWKSDYQGYWYMPITQQFYINNSFANSNSFSVPSYLLGDFFVNVQVKSVTAFLKLSNFNQGIFSPGYYTTPYYPGMSFNFVFGIRWMFYD